MAEYEKARGGKLRLKGGDILGLKKKKRKRKERGSAQEQEEKEKDEDATAHGGWWRVHSIDQISGSVSIEIGRQTYVRALDNGLFTLGAPHDQGEGPAPEEILTAFRIDDAKVALKSGYDKYLRVDKEGVVVGRSDAVGLMEQWEPVFQDGHMALAGCNDKFVSVAMEDESVVARSLCVGDGERLSVRRMGPREGAGQREKRRRNREEEAQEEEESALAAAGGSVEQLEVNYVRKFQKFQDKKLKVGPADAEGLQKAKDEGSLHELMLDRRSKMKADRYCK